MTIILGVLLAASSALAAVAIWRALHWHDKWYWEDQRCQSIAKVLDGEKIKSSRRAEMREHYEELWEAADARVKELTARLVKIQNVAHGNWGDESCEENRSST